MTLADRQTGVDPISVVYAKLTSSPDTRRRFRMRHAPACGAARLFANFYLLHFEL